jgi:DNA-binding transcriptional regulator/RsmH inhibitor MraZ
VTPDGQGRATLPQKVRDAVKLDLTSGATLHMRFHGDVIWMYTEEQWNQMAARNDANRDALKAAAEKLGLV